MPRIFLESHNINNLFFGLGQFNKQLIEALQKVITEESININVTVTNKRSSVFSKDVLKHFSFKKYYSVYRKPFFRIRNKYDLWHSLNQNTKIEPYHDIPYLLTIHDVNFMEEMKGETLLKKKALFEAKLKRSSAITYISNYAKDMTHRYFDIPKVKEYVIYNGSAKIEHLLTAHYEPKIKIKGKYLFFIGEFLEKKNIHTLIEALHFLPDFQLVLAGKNSTNYAEKCRELIGRLGLENRVIITGKISENDKYYYYKNCSAFVFPSLREGFGLPPIEAMQFGTPVFLSNKSALPEVGGKHAFYWEHFDAKYMAEIIIKQLNIFNNSRYKNEQKLKDYAGQYSWDKTAKNYLEVYKSLIFK